MTRKSIEVNDLSYSQYSVTKNTRFKTPMLRSDFVDYSDPYISVKETITVKGTNNANRRIKKLTVRNNPLFRSCISKIKNTFVDNVDDLEISC